MRAPPRVSLAIALFVACGPEEPTTAPIAEATACPDPAEPQPAAQGVDQGVEATPTLTPPDTFDVQAIDRYVAAVVERDPYVGLSLGIMRDGEVVLAKGYGQRSVGGDAVGPDTEFAIASITKQFICAAASRLGERKKLSLDDPVAKWFPELTRAKDITLFDLLSHTSGYPDFYPLDYVIPRMAEPIDTDALIHEFGSRALDFEPRDRYSYSNTGYLIVGRAIERTTRKGLGEHLSRTIFDPIGMQHTFFDQGERPTSAAVGHEAFMLGGPEVATPEGRGWTHAAGAMWSTPTDLMKWDRALVSGEVLGDDAYRRMTARVDLNDGRRTSYGCGLGIARFGGEDILVHTGGVAGFISKNVIIPRTRSAVVVTVNSATISPFPLLDEILALVVAADRETPRAPTVTGADDVTVARELIRMLQRGRLSPDDRATLSPDFNAYLDDARVAEAGPRLEALGDPTEVVVERTWERGGMAVAKLRVDFATTSVSALLYRRPDGIVEEFLLRRR